VLISKLWNKGHTPTQTGVPDTVVARPLNAKFPPNIKQTLPQILDSVREIMPLQYCYESCISFLNWGQASSLIQRLHVLMRYYKHQSRFPVTGPV